MASSTVDTDPKISYWISIKLRASSAAWTVAAATAAIGCPLYRTFSLASMFSVCSFAFRAGPGIGVDDSFLC